MASVRRLVFVASAGDAREAAPETMVVVLDPAWNPEPGRLGPIPLRRLVDAALETTDVVTQSVLLTDAWAQQSGIADRLFDGDLSWWYRIRADVGLRLHESLIWVGVVRSLVDRMDHPKILVPAAQRALREVAAAIGEVEELPSSSDVAGVGHAVGGPTVARRSGSVLRALRRQVVRVSRGRFDFGNMAAGPLRRRVAALSDGRRLLVLTQPSIRQTVGDRGDRRVVDPHLAAVIDRLDRAGWDQVHLGLGLDHRKPRDREILAEDTRLLPQSMLAERWSDRAAERALGSFGDRVANLPEVSLNFGGVDLGPLLARFVQERVAMVDAQRRYALRVGRLLAELHPDAILLDHEGNRTPWIAAASRRGVPVFAIQHGMIYPLHPDYRDGSAPGRPLPTVTYVYGNYERDVLTGPGGFASGRVEVSGSPRVDLDISTPGGSLAVLAAERASLRGELGVAGSDRLLLVSTAAADVYRQFHLPHLIERVLGGPIPGIHLVFKLHPGEQDEGPYRAIVEGLARERGYASPPVSIVRDIDLYRLLRAADAHLGLHSTVLTDAVLAGTLNLVAAVEASGDFLGYVAGGVAIPVRSPTDLMRVLDSPPRLETARREAFLEQHFRSGDASARIVDSMAAHLGHPRHADGSTVAAIDG